MVSDWPEYYGSDGCLQTDMEAVMHIKEAVKGIRNVRGEGWQMFPPSESKSDLPTEDGSGTREIFDSQWGIFATLGLSQRG